MSGEWVNLSGKVVRYTRDPLDPFKVTITIDDKPIDWFAIGDAIMARQMEMSKKK